MAETAISNDTQQNQPLLSVENLTKKFGNITAVDNVTWSVEGGQMTALIGPNGAGKTTFLDLLSGEIFPTGGSIAFRGETITGESQASICRKGIAKSFQSPSVFPTLSVRENIRLSVQRRNNDRLSLFRSNEKFSPDIERTDEVLNELDLWDQADTQAESLSHGDKKKLSLAITVGTDPDVLLLDEPLAGVNDAETETLVNVLNDLSEEFAIVWVEHDIQQVLENSDRISVMHLGEVIATGTPSEIKENQHVQEVYLT